MAGIVAFFCVNALLQRQSHKISPRKTESDTRMVAVALDHVQGIGVVRSYNMDEEANKTMDRVIRDNTEVNIAIKKPLSPMHAPRAPYTNCLALPWCFSRCCSMSTAVCPCSTACCLLSPLSLVLNQLDTAGTYSSLLWVLDLSFDKVEEIFETPVMNTDGKKITPKRLDIAGQTSPLPMKGRLCLTM